MHAHSPRSIPRRALVIFGLLAALASGPLLALAQPGAQRYESYDLGVGQKLTLRSANSKDIKSVVVSRGEILEVSQIDPANATVIQLTAKALGSTRVTLVTEAPEDERNTVIINVLPDLTYIQASVARQFPLARITLSSAAAGVILVSGYADQAEDVDAIINYVQGYGFRVVDNIRVGGVQQVQLEVCVATVDRSELRQMGFNFFQNVNGQYLGSTVGPVVQPPILIQPASPPLSPIPPIFSTGGNQIGIFDPNAGNLFFGVTTQNSGVHAFLQALRQETLVKDLANPNLVTLSGRPATFLVGGDQPYGTAGAAGISGGGGSGIQFRPFGTRLTFIPVVLGDGRIRLEIEAEVSAVSVSNVAGVNNPNIVAPAFTVNRIHTTVEMSNGDSFALGGLLENQVIATTNKVPILGDLPFFGAGFRQVSYREREIEVLIMVTPRLVDSLDCSQRLTKLPSQETRTPTDFELFLEGILEAPRGARDLAPDGCYRPAHWWSGPFCDPAGRGCSGAGHNGGGCSSCGNGGSFGLPGGCSNCGNGHVQTAPVGAPLSSRPEAMPPMAVPTDAPATTTRDSSRSSVTRALLRPLELITGTNRDLDATPAVMTPQSNTRPVIQTGTPATIE